MYMLCIQQGDKDCELLIHITVWVRYCGVLSLSVVYLKLRVGRADLNIHWPSRTSIFIGSLKHTTENYTKVQEWRDNTVINFLLQSFIPHVLITAYMEKVRKKIGETSNSLVEKTFAFIKHEKLRQHPPQKTIIFSLCAEKILYVVLQKKTLSKYSMYYFCVRLCV